MLQDLPVNEWVVLHERLPNIPYESAIAYDPYKRRLVYLAGHIGRLYPQSNCAVLYDFRLNRFFLSQAMYRPQRRCLISAAYIDSMQAVLSCNGSMSHGSMPEGVIAPDGKSLLPKASVGPWLYDAHDDDWENCRPLGPQWKPRSYAPVAYEASSDLLAGLGTNDLMCYRPWTNQVFFRALPDVLKNRAGYAFAADPVRRVFVLFGGVDRGVKREGLSPQEAYDRSVKRDTWVYDVVKDAWREVKPKASPPRGAPMNGAINLAMTYHDPSGTCLLLQPNIDRPETDPAKWGGTTLWSFDIDTQTWTRVETKNSPAVHGLLAYAVLPEMRGDGPYASWEDAIVLVGGGLDGIFDDERTHGSPALSRLVQVCRVRPPGRPVLPPRAESEALLAIREDKGVPVVWDIGSEPEAKIEVSRAETGLIPGEYIKMTPGPVKNEFLDVSAKPGIAYAYQVSPPSGGSRRSRPVFTQPPRPSGLVASIEQSREARLRWAAVARSQDVTGYHVYRSDGNRVEEGKGTRLTEKPVVEPRFTDTTVDLSDAVIRAYWVTAVNALGVESGPSPLAYTVPDAPRGFTVMEGVSPSNTRGIKLGYQLSWDWPKDVKVAGFNLYHASEHLNTFEHPQHYDAFWPLWTKLNDKPLTRNEFAYFFPKENTPNHYFYVRAVNILGQEGFFTDIVSPTDGQYRPAQP